VGSGKGPCKCRMEGDYADDSQSGGPSCLEIWQKSLILTVSSTTMLSTNLTMLMM
jgi:hypothetical protein